MWHMKTVVIPVVSDTFLMFSTIPFFIVPSAPTTTGITTVFFNMKKTNFILHNFIHEKSQSNKFF